MSLMGVLTVFAGHRPHATTSDEATPPARHTHRRSDCAVFAGQQTRCCRGVWTETTTDDWALMSIEREVPCLGPSRVECHSTPNVSAWIKGVGVDKLACAFWA